MPRITETNLLAAFDYYTRQLRRHGIDTAGYEMRQGQPSSGIGWTVRDSNTGNGGHGTDYGNLGMSKREAWHTLVTIARTLEFLPVKGDDEMPAVVTVRKASTGEFLDYDENDNLQFVRETAAATVAAVRWIVS